MFWTLNCVLIVMNCIVNENIVGSIYIKGAVFNFHKNTIIHIHICVHMFVTPKKQCYIQLFYFEKVHSMSESLFLFWSVWFRPLAVYPIIFRQPGLPVCRKHSTLQPWKWANELGRRFYQSKKPQHPSKKLYDHRHIKTRINQLTSLQRKVRRHPMSVALVRVACPQSDNLCEHSVGGGGGGRNNILNLDSSTYFNKAVIIIDCTFKCS